MERASEKEHEREKEERELEQEQERPPKKGEKEKKENIEAREGAMSDHGRDMGGGLTACLD